ncbi:FKBP-type peptidyl-prolyl cis-trans isomerase [Mongoliitalea daihaiensis]|nr:FKBP-type peptidyl-prolyl cis-trans isomerase [Mongoliitalea daihaiensis]
MGGCISSENELELAIQRDVQLIKDFLQRNNIDAVENQLGYFYRKVVTNESGRQIVNNDIVGVYYEIRTIDGQLIESYLNESKPARLYLHGDSGLVPRGINFSSGIAREGETLELFIPSHLAYGGYSFQQLIQPNSNLVVRIIFSRVYSLTEVNGMEAELMEAFIEEKELEGFEQTSQGMWARTVVEGNAAGSASEIGNLVRFTYTIQQMDTDKPFEVAPSSTNSFQIRVGNQENQAFLNLGLTGVRVGQEIDVIVPSRLGFGATTQVFPFTIRQDLFARGLIPELARPYEPLLFKARIISIN